MPFGGGVDVEQDFFLGVERSGLAAVDRVLFTLFVAAVVVVTSVPIGHRTVVLFHSTDDLVENAVLEPFEWGKHCVLVGVLGLDVGEHVGVASGVVPQPVVGIVPVPVGGWDKVRTAFGDGRRRHAGLVLNDGLVIGRGIHG